jgi:hypothetical protein
MIVEQRRDQLDTIQQIKGVDYKAAKQVVIAICNGGGSWETRPYLQTLYRECQRLIDAVCTAYPNVYSKELAKNMRAKMSSTAAEEQARRTTVPRV